MSKKKSNPKHKRRSSDKFQKEILEVLLKNHKKALNYKQIAADLNIHDQHGREVLLRDLEKLLADKKIIEASKGKFKMELSSNSFVGTIDITHSGSAYVTVEGLEEDVYIPKNKKKNSLQGDLVKILVYPSKSRRKHRDEGEVIEILQRSKKLFTGVFEEYASGKYGFVVTDPRTTGVDFYIPKERFHGAENGDLVVVKLKDWPDDAESPFGSIVEVLGKQEDTEAEMTSILVDYGLPVRFSQEVEDAAGNLDVSLSSAEIKKRRDFREAATLTIDPEDAKDFDDALSIQKLKNGNHEIGVHIADVTHYVRPGTVLDREAYYRGNSVYLVDRTVPMLPEKLSNEACSLRPGEDKLCFSAVFEMDKNAKVIREWFGKTVIRSDKRYSYAEAQEIIEGKKGDLDTEILELNRLAKILRKKRMEDGAITFDKDEVKFKLDKHNNPVGTYVVEMKDSNHLIEEFMLLCNRKVSEFVSVKKDGKPSKYTFIYRVHDDPDFEKLNDLRLFIRQFGYTLDLKNRMTVTKSMNNLLREVKGKPEENLIGTLSIRTMSKAKYSTENDVGHYGLAFKYYSHFTAPIRRYSDIIAHRLLYGFLQEKKSPVAAPIEKECIHCTEREKVAVDAERESIKFMQAKYMEQFLGDEFYGFITGVQDYGMYVEIPENRCEGLVKLRDIGRDSFYFDEKSYSIVGRRSGIVYQLGDKVMIRVARVDLEYKQIDFELVG